MGLFSIDRNKSSKWRTMIEPWDFGGKPAPKEARCLIVNKNHLNGIPKLEVSKLSLKSIPPKNGFVTNYAGNGNQTGIPTIKWMDKWMDLY